MREILFRGQTRRKGEKVRMDGTPVESNWVYGGVLQGTGDFSIIYQTKPSIEKKPVYTNTLGQYTGLIDKHGTKIFEGDICHFYGGEYYDGCWEANHTCVIEINHECLWYLENAENVEIIGNIYDNPELIGGKNNA